MPADELVSRPVLDTLSDYADAADTQRQWPAASWQILATAGATRWCIPRRFGGLEWEGPALLEGYARLASACLTTCFLLSQRDAACRRLRDGNNEELREELLPALARGESFATVGLAQLTTSRQHTRPALTARPHRDRFLLHGVIPWVTVAPHAAHCLTGPAPD